MNIFDQGVNRIGTDCEKWDHRTAVFGTDDVLPMWVADMDFASPQPVIDALQKRVLHGAFGYTAFTDADYDAVINWEKRRHGLTVEKDAISFSPGVVDSLRIGVASFTKPGDAVIVQTPIYGPFYSSVEAAGCVIRRNPLLRTKDGWRMDFKDLEEAFKEGAKVLMICNPHNPIGRAWTRAELEEATALARRYGATVIADEIHADLEMPGYKVTPILTVEPDALAFISATKTFNLAALRHSSVLIPNPDRRKAFSENYHKRGINGLNLFGQLAQRVAYNEGEAWLDELLVYLDGNRQVVEKALAERIPQITCSRLEATYLMWLDMSALKMDSKALKAFCIEKARIGFSEGSFFGTEGSTFMRLNLATPRSNVEEAMSRLERAVKQL